jgi:hypothetical protein
MKLTQEGKRIRLAEHFGWTFHSIFLHTDEMNPDEFQEYKESASHCWIRPGNNAWQLEEIPDYFGDLNIIQDALLTLDRSQSISICVALNDFDILGEWDILTAPCNVKADALGITLGLWTSDE